MGKRGKRYNELSSKIEKGKLYTSEEAVKLVKETSVSKFDATRDRMGDVLPVEISIYEDRSFDFIIKTPPTAFLLKKYAKVKKGSATGKNEIVGSITEAQLREIAETKLPDLNAYDVEAAMKIVAGTAKNMGIEIK